MDFHNALVGIGQLEALLPGIKAGLESASKSEQEIKALAKQKLEAETGYRQAHSERAQIIEAIDNLKAQYADAEKSLAKQHATNIEHYSKLVSEAAAAAEKKIALVHGHASKIEAEAAQRIAKAEVEADAAEARVKRAEAALEALKKA